MKIFEIFLTHLRTISLLLNTNKKKNPKKLTTYEQFNEEFCEKFKKEKISQEVFNVGDKVDVLLKSKNTFREI